MKVFVAIKLHCPGDIGMFSFRWLHFSIQPCKLKIYTSRQKTRTCHTRIARTAGRPRRTCEFACISEQLLKIVQSLSLFLSIINPIYIHTFQITREARSWIHSFIYPSIHSSIHPSFVFETKQRRTNQRFVL